MDNSVYTKLAARTPDVKVSDFNGKGEEVAEWLQREAGRFNVSDSVLALLKERLQIGKEKYNNPLTVLLPEEIAKWPRVPSIDLLQELADGCNYSAQRLASLELLLDEDLNPKARYIYELLHGAWMLLFDELTDATERAAQLLALESSYPEDPPAGCPRWPELTGNDDATETT